MISQSSLLVLSGWILAALTLVTNGWGTNNGFWISTVVAIVLATLGIIGSLRNPGQSEFSKVTVFAGVVLILLVGLWMYLANTGV
jgi:preprotein translocase subunit Sss1